MADPEPTRAPAARGPDFGPLYTETPAEIRAGEPFSGTIAEPWNAATAFLFVVIVVWWVIRLQGRFRAYPFFMITLPILLAGGIGGTLYHGLRNWSGWFLLDLIPINLLGLGVSLYFWVRLGPRIWHLVGMLALLGLLQLLGHRTFPTHLAVNVSYAGLGALVLAPIVVVMIRTRGKHAGWVVASLIAFGIAWFCRLVDVWDPPILSMGTHWLWHIFGAVTTVFLSEYVYRMVGINLKRSAAPG